MNISLPDTTFGLPSTGPAAPILACDSRSVPDRRMFAHANSSNRLRSSRFVTRTVPTNGSPRLVPKRSFDHQHRWRRDRPVPGSGSSAVPDAETDLVPVPTQADQGAFDQPGQGGRRDRRSAPDDTAFVHRSPRFRLEHWVQAYGSAELKRASTTGSPPPKRPEPLGQRPRLSELSRPGPRRLGDRLLRRQPSPAARSEGSLRSRWCLSLRAVDPLEGGRPRVNCCVNVGAVHPNVGNRFARHGVRASR